MNFSNSEARTAENIASREYHVQYSERNIVFQNLKFGSEGRRRPRPRSRFGLRPLHPRLYGWRPRPRSRTSGRKVACVPRIRSGSAMVPVHFSWDTAQHKPCINGGKKMHTANSLSK